MNDNRPVLNGAMLLQTAGANPVLESIVVSYEGEFTIFTATNDVLFRVLTKTGNHWPSVYGDTLKPGQSSKVRIHPDSGAMLQVKDVRTGMWYERRL